MKWYKGLICALTVAMITTPAYANIGDMGYWGGTSQGRPLPKTSELMLKEIEGSKSKKAKGDDLTMIYKEVFFLNGEPVEYEGLITNKTSDQIDPKVNAGKYTHTITIKDSDTSPANVTVDKSIVFDVSYRKEGTQIVLDYKPKTWKEEITIDDSTYTLDSKQSNSSMSIIQDKTPGVTYYKGDITQISVYTTDGNDDNVKTVKLDMSGSFYGYDNAWSQAEAQRLDYTLNSDGWQMQYQQRPSVFINKLLQYSPNEPTAISFDGNYREVTQNQSGVSYNIYVKPMIFEEVRNEGNLNIQTFNSFEQLIAPDLSYLKGHYAEADISKLFAMKIFEGAPSYYQPDQSMTRGQFITALVKALKIPIETETAKPTTGKKAPEKRILFPDVQSERPDYPYIMAAYDVDLAYGLNNGYFYPDSPLELQEAIVIMLRGLGLEHLGLTPTPVTSFTDDALIASWAKRELYAAERIGIIYPDGEGRINPLKMISKAEGAAFINRLLTYMRVELADDYSSHVVNYPN